MIALVNGEIRFERLQEVDATHAPTFQPRKRDVTSSPTKTEIRCHGRTCGAPTPIFFSNHGGAVWVKRLELIMRTSLLPSQNIRAFRAHAPSNSSGNVYVRQVYTGTTPEYNGWYTADHEKSYYSAYGVECTKSHFIVHQSFSTAFGGVMYHHHSIRSGRLGLHIFRVKDPNCL